MQDGDIKLHESVAIMTYILERYGASPCVLALCGDHSCNKLWRALEMQREGNYQLSLSTGGMSSPGAHRCAMIVGVFSGFAPQRNAATQRASQAAYP